MTLHSTFVEDVDFTFLPMCRFLGLPLFPFKFETNLWKAYYEPETAEWEFKRLI